MTARPKGAEPPAELAARPAEQAPRPVPPRAPTSIKIDATLPWATKLPFLVVVDKETHRLALYQKGQRTRVYRVTLGRRKGAKLSAGDARTPSGAYRITGKRRHPRYHRFLDISYPNGHDLERYRAVVSEVPPAERPGGPGGKIGIHGTDAEILNRTGVDWTLGCISLLNRDVEELYGLVPNGTPVLIHDADMPLRELARIAGLLPADRVDSRRPGALAAD